MDPPHGVQPAVKNASGNASFMLLAPLLLLTAALLLTFSDVLWRLDLWAYDTISRFDTHDPDDSIVIVAVDEHSLAQLGRWPWPRGHHARLIDRLTDAGVRGIALDVTFAEPDPGDPDGDRRLAEAIARNGRVTMPVMVEPTRAGGTLTEVLPMPALAKSVTSLGHTDIEPERDGLVRGLFLRAGLGSPHWPALALAQLNPGRIGDDVGDGRALSGVRAGAYPDSPLLWIRDNYVMLPQFDIRGVVQVSAADLIEGSVPTTSLTGRWALVGVTGGGLGGHAQVPFRGATARVPGVEFHASVMQRLANNDVITPVPLTWRLLAALAVILLPYVMLHRQRLRALPVTLVSLALLVVVAVPLLLVHTHWWLPPAVPLALLLLLWPLWLLIRMRHWQLLANHDPLTQVANRFQFDSSLQQEWLTARRSRQPMSLLLVDVDRFKAYNDHFGHAAGDRVLASIAKAVADQLHRPRDLVARYGGEEFAVILPDTDRAGARKIAENIRRRVLMLAIHHPTASEYAQVTVSIGIGDAWPATGGNIKALFQETDQALYRAKSAGRNRVVAFADPTEA